jgi:hypothetical protein
VSRRTAGPSAFSGFPVRLVALVNCLRLSLKKAEYVAVDESSVVGNPEYARDDKWRVMLLFGAVGLDGQKSNSRSLGFARDDKVGFALPCNVVADESVEPPQKLIWTSVLLGRSEQE